MHQPADPDALTLRRLGPGDAAWAEALNDLFGAAFDDPATYGGDPPGAEHLDALLVRDHIIVLVAFVGGMLAGGIVAYELDKIEQRRREIYLYDLAVVEEHRRRRVATALIEELQRIAGDRGAWAVFVQADHGDDPAVALYTKLGTREDVMHFDLPPLDRPLDRIIADVAARPSTP